jgi:hypothetical protein
LAVYVDEIIVHHNAWGPFRNGSCHMTADTIDELHEMAAKVGMKREWFQTKRGMWHYDLTPSRRAKAVKLDAVEMSARELCMMMWERRKKASTK